MVATELAGTVKEEVVVPPVNSVVVADPTPAQDQITGDSAHLPPAKDEDDSYYGDEAGDQLNNKFPPSVLVATKLLIGSWVSFRSLFIF